MVWRGMSRYVKRHSITCFKALSWAIVPFTHGVADVSGDPVHTQSAFYMTVRSHVQLLFILGKDSR